MYCGQQSSNIQLFRETASGILPKLISLLGQERDEVVDRIRW